MASSSLIIESTTQGGKKLQKSLSYINPNATNEQLQTFAQKLTALTTNEYVGASVVKKMDVSEGTGTAGGKTIPTLTVTGTGSSRTITYTGDGTLQTTNGTISGNVLSGITADGVVFANETDNFTAQIAEFTV